MIAQDVVVARPGDEQVAATPAGEYVVGCAADEGVAAAAARQPVALLAAAALGIALGDGGGRVCLRIGIQAVVTRSADQDVAVRSADQHVFAGAGLQPVTPAAAVEEVVAALGGAEGVVASHAHEVVVGGGADEAVRAFRPAAFYRVACGDVDEVVVHVVGGEYIRRAAVAVVDGSVLRVVGADDAPVRALSAGGDGGGMDQRVADEGSAGLRVGGFGRRAVHGEAEAACAVAVDNHVAVDDEGGGVCLDIQVFAVGAAVDFAVAILRTAGELCVVGVDRALSVGIQEGVEAVAGGVDVGVVARSAK